METYNFKDTSMLNGLFSIHIFNFGDCLIIDSCCFSYTKAKIKAPIG